MYTVLQKYEWPHKILLYEFSTLPLGFKHHVYGSNRIFNFVVLDRTYLGSTETEREIENGDVGECVHFVSANGDEGVIVIAHCELGHLLKLNS